MGLFAGLNVLPKAAWYTSYSHRVTANMNRDFLRALHNKWLEEGLMGDTANMDFTTVPYWGKDEHLENNWSGKRGRALSSILVALAHDPDSGIINYGDSNVKHENESDIVLEFIDFWHGNSLNNKTLSLIEMSGFNLDDAIDPTDANLIKAREAWMPDAPMENVKNFTVENVSNDVQSLMDKGNTAASTRALYSTKTKLYTGRSSVYFNKNLAFTSPKQLFYAMAHEFQHVSQNALLNGLSLSKYATKAFTNLKEYHGYNYEHYLGSSNYGGFTPNDVRSLSTQFPKYFKSFHFLNFSWIKTVKYTTINFK